MIITERFKFHRRSQNAAKSIAWYIAELRRLAARCNFPRDYLDETLRDRFVCGLRSESIQKQLLAEKELTMTKVLEKAQNLETAQRNAQVLKGQSLSLPISRVAPRSSSSSSPSSLPSSSQPFNTSRGHDRASRDGRRTSCHRCGGSSHLAPDCCFRNAVSQLW